MYILRLSLIFIYFLLSNVTHAEIIETSDYSVIEKFVKKTGNDTLIMFDLDDVLTIPHEPYNLSFPERRKHVKEIEKRIGEQEAKHYWSIILMNRKIKFVDNKIPIIFKYIEDHKISSIALTKCFTHKYGKIQNSHDWRISELKNLGIDFSKTSPFKGDYKITDIKQVNGRPSSTPMIKNGVAFTARSDKGMILERIFKNYNYYPKKILFVDDKYKNLNSIEKLSKKYNIKFEGILITKIHNQPIPKLDPVREKKRFEILKKEERWIID